MVITRTVLALVFVLGACTPASREPHIPRAAPASSPSQAPPNVPREHPNCGFISPTNPRYGSQASSISGRAGDIVTMSGTTLRGENGRFARSHRLEIWWNTKIPQTEVAGAQPVNDDSPIVLLAAVDEMNRCRFRTEFEVPDVPSGTYVLRTFVYSDEGYGLFGWERFTVG